MLRDLLCRKTMKMKNTLKVREDKRKYFTVESFDKLIFIIMYVGFCYLLCISIGETQSHNSSLYLFFTS